MATASAEVVRVPPAQSRRERSLWGDALERLRRNRAAMVGLAVVILFALIAIFAPLLAPYDPVVGNTAKHELDPVFGDPRYRDPAHLLGTDQLGRDILSRLIYSARVSLIIGFVPITLILLIGVTVGLLAGFFGGWLDNFLMRIVDVVYAFPDLLFVITIVTAARGTAIGDVANGLVLIFISIAIVSWVGMARLVRGQVLTLKEREFVEAGRAVGGSNRHLILRHILPNTMAPIIVAAAFGVPGAMLTESTLSFLGIGIKPPTPTWGVMINEGFTVVLQSPWPVLLPALCISIVMLGFTFLGDGLRDALDPRQRS